MSTAFTVATSATQLNCIILLPLDGSNPDSSQLNRKPMGAELSKPLTSNVLKSFKLPEKNRRRLWHWMRMPLTFKCPMCDQWVYKFMCFAGYVQVVLLQSSISIQYIYIILYIDTCLSLSLYSLLYLWRSPSLTKPLRFGLFGWRPWPVPWHPPRAAGPLQGYAGLAAFRATQHVTTYINTSIHIAIEGVWAASTLPVAKGPRCSFSFIFQLFILEGFGASVGTHSKPVYRDAWAHWGGYKDDRAALMHTASGSTALSSTSNLLNRFPKIVDWIWCMCGRPEEML